MKCLYKDYHILRSVHYRELECVVIVTYKFDLIITRVF